MQNCLFGKPENDLPLETMMGSESEEDHKDERGSWLRGGVIFLFSADKVATV
jgi:hypothetical protein